ncbi:MAG: VWA domain-containing protein, partial [Candidatus Thorarchaeota archaeon]
RKWFDTSLDDFSNRPSNPGAALKHGIEQAQSLNESNSLSTTIVFFSSGIYSAGQNPVKVTRMNLGDRPIRILCISVGQDSATDIMEAIAKEGKGKSIHMTSEDRMDSIVDAINDLMISTG